MLMHSVVRHTLLEDYEAMKILVGVESTAVIILGWKFSCSWVMILSVVSVSSV